MALRQHFTSWENLNQRDRAARANGDLSPIGQQKARDAVNTARGVLIRLAFTDFEAAWKDMRARFAKNEKARGRAYDADLKQVPGDVLRNETENLRAFIANTTDVAELRKRFNNEKGSAILARAWARALDSTINPVLSADLAGMRAEAAANVGQFLSPEMQAVNKTGDALATEAQQLIADTKSFATLVGSTNFTGANDFMGLMDGVREKRGPYVPGQGYLYSIDVSEPQKAAFEAGMAAGE